VVGFCRFFRFLRLIFVFPFLRPIFPFFHFVVGFLLVYLSTSRGRLLWPIFSPFFLAVDFGRFSFSLVVSLTGERERVLFSYFWI